MSISFRAADVCFYINWSLAFKWYIIHRQSVVIYRFKQKMPFALGDEGLNGDQVSLIEYSDLTIM